MVIDHIGIVVRSIEQGIAHWEKVFGYQQATEVVLNTRQQVKVVFLEKTSSMPIKLVEPADDASPVAAFAKRGGGLHHLCFRCESVASEVARLKAMGLRVLAEPQPGEAFNNHDIAFIFAKQGLNIELIDTVERACRK